MGKIAVHKVVDGIAVHGVVDAGILAKCCEQGCASVVGCVGFWYSDGQCFLVSPHQPLFQHTLRGYHIFCKTMTWDKVVVETDERHWLLPNEPIIEADKTEGLTCWRKGNPRMIHTFDLISRFMIVICWVACPILLLMSFCTCLFHYALTLQRFPELKGNPPRIVCTMCFVPCEKARRKRRHHESRKRDELLGLDYS